MNPSDQHSQDPKRLWTLTLSALGVVFGDIGTSPLYAFRECFSAHTGLSVTPENILGVLSLIIWTLILVVSIKYVTFVLRADNKGEGGILALLSLAVPRPKNQRGYRKILVYVGLLGATLLYGDGIITPPITVMSAVEGLTLATPMFEAYVLPITMVILILLFYGQSHGTAKIGIVFGPIILVYFLILAGLGIRSILNMPGVIEAFNPHHALTFLLHHQGVAFVVLSGVFLVATGSEALYADMGHFGKIPIRRAWKLIVFPALVLNYMGQGALLIQDPSAISNPFYLLAPRWGLYPLIGVATVASIIASQALISGVFSLTRQAMQLGYCPRLRIVHTSSQEIGQIYIPQMNWALMLANLWIVIEFKSSSNLAAAYGIAVSATMLLTTTLTIYVAFRRWHWPIWACITALLAFLGTDLVFMVSNLLKIADGGWVPLTVAAIIMAMLTTWKKGRRILAARMRAQTKPFSEFVAYELKHPLHRIQGTAIFMTSDTDVTPPALVRNVQHNKVLHERVILLSVVTRDVPRVVLRERVEIHPFPDGFFQVRAFYGFMESPDIHDVLTACKESGLNIDIRDVTFFLGRETIIAARRPDGMAVWREHLFAFMARNAQRATTFFKIPADQVFEIGTEVEL